MGLVPTQPRQSTGELTQQGPALAPPLGLHSLTLLCSRDIASEAGQGCHFISRTPRGSGDANCRAQEQ